MGRGNKKNQDKGVKNIRSRRAKSRAVKNIFKNCKYLLAAKQVRNRQRWASRGVVVKVLHTTWLLHGLSPRLEKHARCMCKHAQNPEENRGHLLWGAIKGPGASPFSSLSWLKT